MVEITSAAEKTAIDQHMETHKNIPPDGTAVESGLTSFQFAPEEEVAVNPSMLEKTVSSSGYIISRLAEAPALPVSCLASTEHVIAMQNEVTDFVSEYEPESKKHVMYQILVRSHGPWHQRREDEARILGAILETDTMLNEHNLCINYSKKEKLFTIEVLTQLGDIQKILKAIKNLKTFAIVNCSFTDIGLNEGICLVKADLSNPIHAMVNIADSSSRKVFLERDAGSTSGLLGHLFQNRSWMFGVFQNLKDMQEKTGYNSNSIAVKIRRTDPM